MNENLSQKELNLKYHEERSKLKEILSILSKLKPRIEKELTRTGELARKIGKALNVEDDEYYLAGFYANLGLLGIEHFILDERRISKQEYELIQRHPIISAEILENKGLHKAAQFVLYHHEKPNGRGYFKMTTYPKECAYINIADRFQSYVSHQVFRPRHTLKEAINKVMFDYKDYIFIKKPEFELIEEILRESYEALIF